MKISLALDLHFPADEGIVARATARLDDCSPAAVHEIGPDDAQVWRVFFADGSARDEAARVFQEDFAGEGLRVVPVDVPDEDWAARSQAGLRAVRVGRLVIAPPWDVPGYEATSGSTLRTPGRAGDIVIVIQPSMGFGTGHHETTRLCLALLQDTPVAGRDVLDVGTGSGVLAIAAALLGGRSVLGVDIDEDALGAARENIALNAQALAQAGGKVGLSAANLRDGLAPADLVIANLTGGLLVSAAAQLRAAIRAGGHLLASGFQPHESDAVLEALAPRGGLVERRREGEWEAALVGR